MLMTTCPVHYNQFIRVAIVLRWLRDVKADQPLQKGKWKSDGTSLRDAMEQLQPRVGIGVMILKDGKVLLGKRKGSHGAVEYAFPGGHLEYRESFEDCARREVHEECGVEITNLRFQFVANVTTYAPKHYVHLGFIADWKQCLELGEPQALGRLQHGQQRRHGPQQAGVDALDRGATAHAHGHLQLVP